MKKIHCHSYKPKALEQQNWEKLHSANVSTIEFNSSGNFAGFLLKNGCIEIWDLASNPILISTLKPPVNITTSIAKQELICDSLLFSASSCVLVGLYSNNAEVKNTHLVMWRLDTFQEPSITK